MIQGILLGFLTVAMVTSTPVEEHIVKREAMPNPIPLPSQFLQPPPQTRQPREAFGQGYGFDRGFGGEYLGGGGGGIYEKEFFGPREEYGGRYGGGYERDSYGPSYLGREEFGRYGGGYEREGYGPEFGRFGYEREEIIRPEIVEKVVRPEIIEKVERFEGRPFGYGGHGHGHGHHRCNCHNKFENGYDFPKFEGLFGGRHGLEGGFPGYCVPYHHSHYNNYNNY